MLENKILTAICTDYYGNKNQVVKRSGYKTKKEFHLELRANGYRNIRIYTEEDFEVMNGGIYKTVRGKKISENRIKRI